VLQCLYKLKESFPSFLHNIIFFCKNVILFFRCENDPIFTYVMINKYVMYIYSKSAINITNVTYTYPRRCVTTLSHSSRPARRLLLFFLFSSGSGRSFVFEKRKEKGNERRSVSRGKIKASPANRRFPSDTHAKRQRRYTRCLTKV